MVKENQKFWESKGRIKKANALDMKIVNIYTLASIIEQETNKNDEKPRMAGVYLNRLKKGYISY